MNKSKNLLTFLTVALLAITLPISLYILRTGSFDFRISAFESDEPVHVLISDVKSDSFQVTWITEKPVYGAIKTISSLQPVTESLITSNHSIIVKNVEPNSDITFQILSDGKSFETLYTVSTPSISNLQSNQWIFGQVFAKDGVSTQRGGIVSLQLEQGQNRSQLLSTTINETGGYKFNLGSLLNEQLNQEFNTKTSVNLRFLIYSEFNSEPIEKIFTLDLSKEIQVPNIYLADINIDIIPGIESN